MPLGALGGAGDTEAEPLASVVDHISLIMIVCIVRRVLLGCLCSQVFS